MLIFDNGSLTGIDMGSYAVKVVKLKGKGANRTLDAIAYSALDHITLPEDNSRLSGILRNIFNVQRIKKKKVATVFPDGSLTFAHLYLPRMPKKDMKEAVRWEMRKQIAFSPEELICDFITIGDVKRGDDIATSLIAFGARKSDIEQLIRIFEDALLDPVMIDVAPIAMLSAFDYNNVWESGVNYSMIDIGESRSILAILKEKKLMFAREISIGGRELTMLVMEKLGSTEEEAEREKIRCGVVRPEGGDSIVANALIGAVEKLITEVRRSFDYYQAQFREDSISKIFLCGGTSKLKGIDDMLANSLNTPCFIDDPLRNIKIEPKRFEPVKIREFAPDMTVAVGLAL